MSEYFQPPVDGNGSALQIRILVDGKRVPYLVSQVVDQFKTKAPAMILEAAKYEALEGVKLEYGTLLVQLMGNPTREERDTWERQRDWAVRHNNDDATAAPLLVGLLTADERTALGDNAATVMAQKILAKNAGAEQLISLAGGIRRTAEKAVEAATSVEEVEAAVMQARTAAAQAIAQVQAAQG